MTGRIQQPTTHEYKAYVDGTMGWMLSRLPDTERTAMEQQLQREGYIARSVGAAMGVAGCREVIIEALPPIPNRPDIEPRLEVMACAKDMFARLVLMRGRRKGIIFEVTDQANETSLGRYLSPTRRAKMFDRPRYTVDTGLVNSPARFFRPANPQALQLEVQGIVSRTMEAIEKIPNFKFCYE